MTSPGWEPLALATSLIDPFSPGGRGAAFSRRSLFTFPLNRPQAATLALPLLPPIYPAGGYTSAPLLSNYYMSSFNGYSMRISTPSTEPGHIKGSGISFQSRKLAHYQLITQVARSSPSQSWEDCIMITADVPEFFQICADVIA
jgi:hypothetical protein